MSSDTLLDVLFASELNCLCTICKKYLTVLPIYYAEDIGHVCGRCTSNVSEIPNQLHKQTVYENILKNFKFPCSYKKHGCKVVLDWTANVVAHEKNCDFQLEVCPLNYYYLFHGVEKCTWSGISKEFVEHVEKNHHELIKENPFQLVLENTGRNSVCFNRAEMELVTIVVRYFKENVYYLMVMLHGSFGDSQCFSVDLKVFDRNEATFLSLHKDCIVSLKDLVELFESDGCEKVFRIDFVTIENCLRNCVTLPDDFDRVIVKFELTKKSATVSDIDRSILRLLKCTKCDLFMTNGVNECENNHSKCTKCIVSDCSICGSSIYYENEYLNQLSATTFVCPNRIYGCSLMDRYNLNLHRQMCNLKYRQVKCTVTTCKWEGRLDLFTKHFQESHPQILIEDCSIAVSILVNNDYDSVKYARYMNVDGAIFRIRAKLQDRDLLINVTHYQFEEFKYYFQLQLYTYSLKSNFCITVPGTCAPIDVKDPFKDATVIHRKMLETLTTSSFVEFKLRIFKADK